MPTIPTFTAKGTPTTEVGSVRSTIKVNPNASKAAALAPIGKAAEDYYIKQRDNNDKLQSDKEILLLKAEQQNIIESLKTNPDRDDAINMFNKKFTPLLEKSLLNASNRRVKNLIKQGMDLGTAESTYFLTKNSFKQYQQETIKVYNDKMNSGMAKYKLSDNAILKAEYIAGFKLDAEKFNKEHMLGEFDLKERIKTIDRVLLLTDAESLIGTEDAVSNIAKLDTRMNGSTLLPDETFNKQLYNSYAQKIESIAIKGDPNSDYEEAERLLNELQTLKRGDGSKIVSGPREKAFAILKQKTLTESINHDTFVTKISQGTEFFNYQTEQRKLLEGTFFNQFIPTMNKAEDKEKAAEAGMEFDARINTYSSSNPDATYFEQQQFARELRLNLFDKYEDIAIAKLTAFNLTENKFNVVREINDVQELAKQYYADPAAKNTLKTIAKLNGFVKEDGTILMREFMDEYIPILKARQEN